MSEHYGRLLVLCLVLFHILETCQSAKNDQTETCQPSVKPKNSILYISSEMWVLISMECRSACYTEPSGKSLFEIVWKIIKRIQAGDWTNYLSVTVRGKL